MRRQTLCAELGVPVPKQEDNSQEARCQCRLADMDLGAFLRSVYTFFYLHQGRNLMQLLDTAIKNMQF